MTSLPQSREGRLLRTTNTRAQTHTHSKKKKSSNTHSIKENEPFLTKVSWRFLNFCLHTKNSILYNTIREKLARETKRRNREREAPGFDYSFAVL